MRPLYVLALTLAWFLVALLSYSQVEAQSPPEPRSKPCRVVTEDGSTSGGLESEVTVGNGKASARTTVGSSTGTGSGVTVHSHGNGSSSSAAASSSDGSSVATGSGDDCVIVQKKGKDEK
ncbi:hypothetical protein [Rhodoligotrophos ferricapiens]|uniref:hypothetical protein n=1 Tax=Rhodoligotrophos ferricapiens TaxID=3069264 RepID=UPI00315CA422